MLDPVPWLVGGGAEHSPEVVRRSHYDATGGAEGISGVTSLKVAADTPAGTNIRVFGGGATLNNRYAGAGGQSYSVRNASTTKVAIKATGSASARTDLVVIRVLDPQYEGAAPADPNDFQYTRLEVIEGISAGVETAEELNLGYPAIALAKVTLPKSTATVTSAMIEDLREVAQPRTLEVMRPKASVGSDTEILTAIRYGGEWFPNGGGRQRIYIPEWATRMQIRAEWFQLEVSAGNAWGHHWVGYGPGVGGFEDVQDRKYSTQRFMWNTANTDNNVRDNWFCVDDVWVPADIRGTTQTFVMKARRESGTAVNTVRLTPLSGTNLQVRFMEVADRSTS